MVVHSTTKFLNGHSDGLGGVVVCTQQQQADQLTFIQKIGGCDSVAIRVLADPSGSEDAGCTHGTTRPQRPSGGEFLAKHKK